MANCCKQNFENFSFFVNPDNTSGATNIVLTSDPRILASFDIHSDMDDDVLLSATVGWQANVGDPNSGVVDVLFKIWRGNPNNGTLIFSALVGGESDFEKNYLSSFSHVDTNLPYKSRKQLYFLTAQLVLPTPIPTPAPSASVIGPITFTGITIDSRSNLSIY